MVALSVSKDSLVVWDGPKFLDMYFENHNSYLRLTNNGPFDWTLDNSAISPTQLPASSLKDFDFVLGRLKFSSPIFSRHYDSLATYELDLRKIAMNVLGLSVAFKELNVKAVLFPTGVPHHLDTLICQLSCQISSVRQIFLYPTIFGNRLLPLEMTDGIETRKRLVSSVSEFKLPNSSHKVLSLLQTSTQQSDGPFSFSLFASYYRVCTRYFRNLYLRKKQTVITGRSPNRPADLKRPSLARTLGLMRSANLGMKYLDTLINIDKVAIGSLMADQPNSYPGTHGFLTLFAHLQPEATTFPEGGDFSNHIDLIARIRASGYSDPIFYKEHPAMRKLDSAGFSMTSGTARNVDYYDRLKQMGCFFIDDDTFRINHQRLLVLTVSGTVAIERSINGLSTVVAGFPWYLGLPGTLSLETFLSNPKLTLKPREDISKSAISYLDHMLSKNTFENILGIGELTVENMELDNSVYQLELIQFLNFLLSGMRK